MESGNPNPHIDYDCPECGKLFRSGPEAAGSDATCPDCSTIFQIPSAEGTPDSGQTPGSPIIPAGGAKVPGAKPPPRSRYATDHDYDLPPEEPAPARRDRTLLTPTHGDEVHSRWSNTWAIASGVALLFAILLPVLHETYEYPDGRFSEREETVEAVFLWETLDDAPALRIIGLLASIGLGIFAIVAGAKLWGRTLGHSLFWIAASATYLSLVMWGGPEWREFYRFGPGHGGPLGLLLLASLIAIAAGNHLRKARPNRQAPRLMVGIGGIVLVAWMVIPTYDDHLLIESFFEGDAWENAPAIMICGLAFAAYMVLAIVSFKPGVIRGLNTALSILARCIMIGLPVAIILTAMMGGDEPPNFFVVFLRTVKGSLLLYAHLVLVAVGLATLISSYAGDRAAESA